jgi:hypothetical protein
MPRFGALFDSQSGDQISQGAALVYMRKHPELARPDDYLDGLSSPDALTKAAIERYARAVFFEILHEDPSFVLKTFLYYKPQWYLSGLIGDNGLLTSSVQRLSNATIAGGLLLGLLLAFAMAPLSRVQRELLVIAIITSVGFMVSSAPVVITVPYWPALADQLYILLIAMGAWCVLGVTAVVTFCHRIVVSRRLTVSA